MRVHQNCHAKHLRRQAVLVKRIVTSGTAGAAPAIIILSGIIAASRESLDFSQSKTAVKGCEIAFCRFAKDAYLCHRNGKAVY